MLHSYVRRPFPLLFLFLFSLQGAFFGSRASAQIAKNIDAAVNAFGQFTSSTSGNGVSDNPSRSTGGLATVRQSFKPWLGYEINYSYTRFSEFYSNQVFGVQNNLHEVSGAYLVQGPKLLGFQPFATVGAAWLIFLPTEVGGQRLHKQNIPGILYEVGVNYPLFTDHFGARFEYRGLLYQTPSLGTPQLVTNSRRQTAEPTAGLYIRF
jgi:hypothetical protein